MVCFHFSLPTSSPPSGENMDISTSPELRLVYKDYVLFGYRWETGTLYQVNLAPILLIYTWTPQNWAPQLRLAACERS